MISGKFPFDLKFFIDLAKDVVPMFRKHTFMDALDVKGKKFKKYSQFLISVICKINSQF